MTKLYKKYGIILLIFGLIIGLLIWKHPYFRMNPELPAEYSATVFRYAAKYNLDPALVFAVIRTESNFEPDARSDRDARGLMQITASTLEWAMLREGKNETYTAEDLYDPHINIRYGCYILSLLQEEFADEATMLAAYNAGRSNALKWLKDSRYSSDGITLRKTPYRETNNYIKKVQKYTAQYQERSGDSS